MTELELKRLELEKIKVSAAKSDLEFRILERLDEIKRIEDQIKIQSARMLELDDMIKKGK